MITASAADGAEPGWSAVARADTLVVLMTVGRLEQVCDSLVGAGRSPGEPAAIIQSATTARERCVRSVLGTIARASRAAGIAPPATLVVGPVVALANELSATAPGSHRQPAHPPAVTSGSGSE